MGSGLIFLEKDTKDVYLSLGFKNYASLGVRLEEHNVGDTTFYFIPVNCAIEFMFNFGVTDEVHAGHTQHETKRLKNVMLEKKARDGRTNSF